jgi:hypothetical protein
MKERKFVKVDVAGIKTEYVLYGKIKRLIGGGKSSDRFKNPGHPGSGYSLNFLKMMVAL